jgi:hypothetical protein
MAKFRCYCDTIIQTSGLIPNPNEWKGLSDQQFDEWDGQIDVEEIYRAATSFFKCPTCGRLWFYWNGFEHDPVCHRPEDLDASGPAV